MNMHVYIAPVKQDPSKALSAAEMIFSFRRQTSGKTVMKSAATGKRMTGSKNDWTENDQSKNDWVRNDWTENDQVKND